MPFHIYVAFTGKQTIWDHSHSPFSSIYIYRALYIVHSYLFYEGRNKGKPTTQFLSCKRYIKICKTFVSKANINILTNKISICSVRFQGGAYDWTGNSEQYQPVECSTLVILSNQCFYIAMVWFWEKPIILTIVCVCVFFLLFSIIKYH